MHQRQRPGDRKATIPQTDGVDELTGHVRAIQRAPEKARERVPEDLDENFDWGSGRREEAVRTAPHAALGGAGERKQALLAAESQAQRFAERIVEPRCKVPVKAPPGERTAPLRRIKTERQVPAMAYQRGLPIGTPRTISMGRG